MEDGLREPALTVTDPQARAAEQARSIASHMALSGYPRWKTEDQLRGTVDQRALGQMLDEVYGAQSQVG